jgi:hypothetical protein
MAANVVVQMSVGRFWLFGTSNWWVMTGYIPFTDSSLKIKGLVLNQP